jgi:nicotinate-nucleotide adenylyltransferase
MVIGVFGGSFNPVHNGHIALAREVVARRLADKVLMVVSPLNPLKENPQALIDDAKRLEMLRLACAPYPELEASGIELSMPRPSYSIATLNRLSQKHPADRFRLIIGADNWACFTRWRSYEAILRDYAPIVYPRDGYPLPTPDSDATPMDAELYPISSTQVRAAIAAGEPIDTLIPLQVANYINEHSLYSQG